MIERVTLLPLAASPLITVAAPLTACALLGAAAYTCIAPSSNFWGPVISRGDSGGAPRYALTFDDGPTDDSTLRILDTLSKMNTKAAFFVIGQNVRRNPEIVRRIHAEGHIVGNHSFDHPHYGIFRLGRYWETQLRDTNALIHDIIGQTPAYYRPPMGVRTGHSFNAARRTGHTMVTWTRRGMDGFPTTADRIVNRLAPRTQPGDILVLHDGIEPHLRRNPAPTVAAIKPLIAALRERGLVPAALDQFIGIPAYAAT